MENDESKHSTPKGRLHQLRTLLAHRQASGDTSDLDLLLKLRDDLEREERIEREAIEAARKRDEEAEREMKRRQDEDFLRKTTMGDD